MRAVADWWDAIELWLTQLQFGFQVVLAIVVVLPLCWAAAVSIDRLADRVAAVVESRLTARRASRQR